MQAPSSTDQGNGGGGARTDGANIALASVVAVDRSAATEVAGHSKGEIPVR